MAARPPSIVLVVADDFGYGDLGYLNGGISQTPALDQLAADGLALSQAYAASPVCAPSRAGLYSGCYPHRTCGIDTLEGRGLDRIARGVPLLPAILSAHGFATGLIGKWHNGAGDPAFHPTARGFQEFVGFSGGWADYWQWTLDEGTTPRRADGRYLTDVFTEAACSFLRRHRDEPFFLNVTYNAPHFPMQATDEDLAAFPADSGLTLGVRTVYAMNRAMDRGIAALRETLTAIGRADETLFIFTSDNGPQFSGEGEESIHRFNTGLNGAKGRTLEGGIRVPWIMSGPDLLDRRGTDDTFFHFTDVLPTFLHLCGLADHQPDGLDGRNVLPAWQGARDETPPQRFWQWNRYQPLVTTNAAYRDGPWKLVRPPQEGSLGITPEDQELDIALKYDPDARLNLDAPWPERDYGTPPAPLLFNLDEDPAEAHDLAAAEPARVDRMTRELQTWFDRVEADRRAHLKPGARVPT